MVFVIRSQKHCILSVCVILSFLLFQKLQRFFFIGFPSGKSFFLAFRKNKGCKVPQAGRPQAVPQEIPRPVKEPLHHQNCLYKGCTKAFAGLIPAPVSTSPNSSAMQNAIPATSPATFLYAVFAVTQRNASTKTNVKSSSVTNAPPDINF